MHSIKTEVNDSFPTEELNANLQTDGTTKKRKVVIVKEEPIAGESTSHSPVKMIKTENDASNAQDKNFTVEQTSAPIEGEKKPTMDLDWLLHYTFWNTKMTESNTCPKCGDFAGAIDPVRRAHYIRYHYDIYYSVIGQRAKEVWVSRRLGGRPERNPRTRACLHCSQARGTRKFFEGRIKLLKHIAKEHSEVFAQFRDEYAELSPEAKVDDKELHDLLTAVTSPQVSAPVVEPKKEEKQQKKVRTKRKETLPFHAPLNMFNPAPILPQTSVPNALPTIPNQPSPTESEQANVVSQLLPPFPVMPFYFPQPMNFLLPFSILPQFPQPFLFPPQPFITMPNLYALANMFPPQQPQQATVIDLTED